MSVTIKIMNNGPYIVEGDFKLTDANGQEIPAKKAALCRCGGSRTKPFCDGSHKTTRDEEDGKTYEYDAEGHRHEI